MNKEEIEKIKTELIICNDSDIGIGKENLEKVLNLIDKQQEELDKITKAYRKLQAFYSKDYVSKDKIKDKIKEVEFYINNVDNYVCFVSL